MAKLPSIDLSAYFAKVPLRVRIALGALLVILVGTAYWQFFLRANWAELDQTRAEYVRLQAEVERTRRLTRQRPVLEHEIKLLEARLSRVVLHLPKDKEIPALLTRIAGLGRETDLVVSLFKPGPQVSKGFYTEVPVQLKVTGMYHNLGTLFEQLGKIERIVNVANLAIRHAGKEKKADSVEAEFGLVTYTYTGSTGAKSGGATKTGT